MKGEKLSKLILDGLLITEDGHLVVHDGAHVGPESLHIWADEDPVLLGLIPVCIKLRSEVVHLVLEGCGMTNRVLLRGWPW